MQAFLAETMETGDKNRDDFHCIQMSRDEHAVYILAMTEVKHVSWSRFCCLAMNPWIEVLYLV